jgi:uncharacterized protein YjbI with pentapeptide repeats
MEDQRIEGISYAEGEIIQETFDYCTFVKCNFTKTQVALCLFNDCSFVDCNLSMTDFNQSTLNNVSFKNCKILGVSFGKCHDFIFEVSFDNCVLDYSSFEKRKMPKTSFLRSSLKGTDFGLADMKQCRFVESDLTEAIFYNTNLQEADFSTAYNYTIDPDENNIKKARFSREGLTGLLYKYNIIIE